MYYFWIPVLIIFFVGTTSLLVDSWRTIQRAKLVKAHKEFIDSEQDIIVDYEKKEIRA